eukprot:scaffold280744_cov31-Tisochrysis_lutea.AAC.2
MSRRSQGASGVPLALDPRVAGHDLCAPLRASSDAHSKSCVWWLVCDVEVRRERVRACVQGHSVLSLWLAIDNHRPTYSSKW